MSAASVNTRQAAHARLLIAAAREWLAGAPPGRAWLAIPSLTHFGHPFEEIHEP
jgi:hypothetical protein